MGQCYWWIKSEKAPDLSQDTDTLYYTRSCRVHPTTSRNVTHIVHGGL